MGPVGVICHYAVVACWLVVSHDHRTSCSSSCGDLGAAAFTDDRASKSLSPGGEALEGIAHQNVGACHEGHDQPSEHKFGGVER